MTDAQTEARVIAQKLQDVVDGTDGWLNVDKAAGIIATALAAKDAELAAVKENCETVCNSYADENQRLYDRAERAEARLAQAMKTLGPFAKIKPSTAFAEDGSEAEPYRVFLAARDDFDFTGADLAAARRFIEEQEGK